MTMPKGFQEELRTMIKEAVDGAFSEQDIPEEEDEEMEAVGEMDAMVDDEEEMEPVAEMGEMPTEDAAAQAAAVILNAVQNVADDMSGEGMEMEMEMDDEEEYPMDEAADLTARLDAIEAREMLATVERQLETTLAGSRLPTPFQSIVREQFQGRTDYTQAEVNMTIKRTREAVAQVDPTGRVAGAGATGARTGRVSVGLTGVEQAEVDFLRLVAGHNQFRGLESIQDEYTQDRLQTPAFRSWVKAGRPRTNTVKVSNWMHELLGGNPLIDPRAAEAVSTTSMTSIIKNTLNLLLAANYSKRHQWWNDIVTTEEVETIDDATLVRVHGLNTLQVVEEGQAYNELEWADEEETAVFVKKGNFVGVTIETMLRDKLNMIRTIPARLSDSWYNTLSTLVSNVFTINAGAGPTLSDSGALFNATALTAAGGHTNLLTTAYAQAAHTAVYTAMQKQTDQVLGAGQRLLATPKFILGPPDLRTSVLQVRNSELIPGSANNDVNVHYQDFEWIPVPTFTDADDWAAVADPSLFPAIWLIFLRGRAVPELFTADSEVAGAMFTNDTIRYKVRMLTWRFNNSSDCAPVGDWRGLHKNNV